LVRNEPPELVLVVITVDDPAEFADAAADGEVLLLALPLLLPLLHAAAAISATASGAASLIGTGTRASNEALIVIIPLARRCGLFAAAAQFGCNVRTMYGRQRRRGLDRTE
jgi:hypothetical protein